VSSRLQSDFVLGCAEIILSRWRSVSLEREQRNEDAAVY